MPRNVSATSDPPVLRSAIFPRSTIPAIAIIAVAVFSSLGMTGEPPNLLPLPLSLRAKDHTLSLTLHAAIAADGKNSFYYNGQPNAPTLRLSPGDQLKITYINDLPANPRESCGTTPCMDMTNLHFHGLTVSPDPPQDDVLSMMAMPGQTLRYIVQIPKDHPPGLYWYHTHPHGESHRQVLDGMSGAIVIEGIERYFPEVDRLRERIIVVRGRSLEHEPNAAALTQDVEIPSGPCGRAAGSASEIFTVNGAVRPRIEIAPQERQFWRIVNASADRYLDLQLDGQTFEIVALDGMPLAYHEPRAPTRTTDHLLLAPAGRLEAIVTGPPSGSHRALRTLCVDTGPDGDPNPGMVLADLVQPSSDRSSSNASPKQMHATGDRPPLYQELDVERLKKTAPDFT